MNDLHLDLRTGWPADLRYLLDRYPREVWPTHPNLGATAQFWLRRHRMFRELGAALTAATGAFREGRLQPAEYRAWFLPRLGFFLTELEGHHHIEDAHYFPLFVAAERGLQRGFDALDGDHHLIHDDLGALSDSGRALAQALASGRDGRAAADRWTADSDRLLARLSRHLDDEEDLVAPLILDRGEGPLGL
ncbi:MAG: hemerythrin domain-containing protein [Rubrimonas sp.]